MTYLKYVDKKLGADKLELIRVANQILEEYARDGTVVTLRQLYYQLVSRDYLPNNDSAYDQLGDALNDGRMVGLVSWTAIEDRLRQLQGLTYHDGPEEIIKAARATFKRDLWADQPIRPEVWVEKDAMTSVVEGICNELRVDFFACRGYASQSSCWRAGRRFANYISKGQRPIVFHLGDHDPSGLDMTRDNRERLETFVGVPIQVVRLALNRDQIERYRPPPNPAKKTDVRYRKYYEETGLDESWELDALRPNVIRSLIADAVHKFLDQKIWAEALQRETEEKEILDEVVERLEDEE